MREKRQTGARTAAVLTVGGLLVISGIFLPGLLLHKVSVRELGEAAAAPEGYYQASYSAMARNSSEKLDITEKLQLITGQWNSIKEEPQDFELEHTDYEVAELAQKGIGMLYQSGLYPEDITGYENWYSWQATPHKAVDTTFHTYTAYYWEVVFEKYDETISHKVYVLDNGTVFLAVAGYGQGEQFLGTEELLKASEKGKQTAIEQTEWTDTWREALQFTDIAVTDYPTVYRLKVENTADSYEALRAESSDSSMYFRLPQTDGT